MRLKDAEGAELFRLLEDLLNDVRVDDLVAWEDLLALNEFVLGNVREAPTTVSAEFTVLSEDSCVG